MSLYKLRKYDHETKKKLKMKMKKMMKMTMKKKNKCACYRAVSSMRLKKARCRAVSSTPLKSELSLTPVRSNYFIFQSRYNAPLVADVGTSQEKFYMLGGSYTDVRTGTRQQKASKKTLKKFHFQMVLSHDGTNFTLEEAMRLPAKGFETVTM